MCQGFYHEQMRVKNGRHTLAGKVTCSDIIPRNAETSYVLFIKKNLTLCMCENTGDSKTETPGTDF